MASSQVSSQNYVHTRTMLTDNGSSYVDVISYSDGLGRPFQTVRKSLKDDGSGWNILAMLQEYDAAGRESVGWLPVSAISDFTSPSGFQSLASGNYGGDDAPYSRLSYESSPLKRVIRASGPGADWHNGHPAGIAYTMNLTSSPYDCTNYSVGDTGGLVNTGIFMPAQLFVTQSTDEDGNVSYTFTDKLDRLLLERRMKGGEAHDTYYVYDRSNRLCFVLQPMYQTTPDLDRYSFQYRYDGRDNCVYKKLPGAQHVLYEYDGNDRMVFSQDGNRRLLATGNWTYYKYDGFGRLTQQGECTGKNTSSNTVVHVQNYYDDYSFVGSTGFPAGSFVLDTSGHGKGSLTGSVITVLDSGTKLYAAYYYDIKGRVVKTVQSNLLGGYDVTSTVYTFTDNPSTLTHTHTASGKPTRTEVYSYSYDHADRVSKVEHTLGGTKVTLAGYAYDNLGRLQSKSLHGSAANKLTYAYNVRSWLTGISGSKFTQNLYYNTGNGTAKYNGSISSMTWQAGDDSTVRGYKFTYDGLDRIQNAIYGETASLSTNINRFSENVSEYDKNGNIKSLQRYGRTGASAYGMLDNLTYTLNGNQLTRVDDAVTTSAYNSGFEFKDGVKQANEYTYDSNGNLTKDLNKGITDIQYNCLNLPSQVTFSDGSTITYTYAADGTKLKTAHKMGNVTLTADYCGNVIYENGVQKLLLTEEGYINLTGTQQYHYYLKDHQGNNRVAINQSGTVEETNHYYPFGGVFASTGNAQPYKYNGKEYDTKKGLNWYDYGARHYDAALGRFTTVDPLAEKHYSTNPFTYCLNNPLKYVDPLGTDTISVIDQNIRPFDRGKSGETYTATIQVIQNGEVVGVYEGSSYPNSVSNKDNSTNYNTIAEGEYDFNNKSGHKGGTQKGLNIVDESGNRYTKGFDKNGNEVQMQYVNVHSGKSDNGNYNSRGSQGCITINPKDAKSFFSHFKWNESNPNVGNSQGRIIIKRIDLINKKK